MQRQTKRKVVFLGGGHANVLAIAELAPAVQDEARLILISESRETFYSGMIPGCVAGIYKPEEAIIQLEAVAEYYGLDYVWQKAEKILPNENKVLLTDGTEIDYDYLSVDIGSRTKGTYNIPGVNDFALTTRPVNALIEKIENVERGLAASSVEPKLVICGGGVAAAELALTLQARWMKSLKSNVHVTIVHKHGDLVSGYRERQREHLYKLLKSKRISVISHAKVTRVTQDRVHYELETDQIHHEIPHTICVWATGAESHDLFSRSGLSVDELGFMYVNEQLQSVDYNNIFGAGDCINIQKFLKFPPKAGVYAVREAVTLAQNLGILLQETGEDLRRYHPQKEFLSLMTIGDGRSLGGKFGVSFCSRWTWFMKDHLDKSFMNMFDPNRLFKRWDQKGCLRREREEIVDLKENEEKAVAKEAAARMRAVEAAELMKPDSEDNDTEYRIRIAILDRMNAEEDFRDEVVALCSKYELVVQLTRK